MDGMHKALGVGGVVFFDGKQCVVHARSLEFDALVEAEILKKRPDPFPALVEGAKTFTTADGTADLQRIRALAEVMTDLAISHRNARWDEHIEFLNSPRGEAVEFWACLKHEFGQDWTIDRVQWVLQESYRQAARVNVETLQAWYDWKNGIRSAIDRAGGDDVLGNLTGLRAMPPTNPVPPRGQSSVPSSTDPTGPEPEASTKSEA